MPDIRFDTYYKYDEITSFVHAFAEEYPELVRVQSIGKSYEGRDIWLVTITNFETGPDDEKPALWVSANLHATEMSPSTLALLHIHTLVNGYGNDDEITCVLDTRVYYIVPRISVDGAELALADHPKVVRSSVKPYPFDEHPVEGLIQEDIDKDGRLLFMRIPDPNGTWKKHPDDPRLMIRRDPVEAGGDYYRILPEGRLENYDGATIHLATRREGLDINRNFPSMWRVEGEQYGAGPYPTSEPEVKALVDFIVEHPNITGGVDFHTMSGVLLRPYGTKPDDEMPAEDLWTYQKIGDKGTELTGYPNISVFHEFKYHPKQVITGVFDDWMYDHLGFFGWTVELWSPQRQAGITDYKYIDWYREHPVEHDLMLMKWNDEVLDGQGYVDWYTFDHPQLGQIELGGWKYAYAWRNPPPHLLEKEIAPFPKWLIWHLLISPKLELIESSVEKIDGGAYRVRVVAANTGWLPSYISKMALQRKSVRGVVAEIDLPDDAALVSGKSREVAGQLEGRAYKLASFFNWMASDTTSDRVKFEWVVNAPSGGSAEITVKHARAGVVRATVDLA